MIFNFLQCLQFFSIRNISRLGKVKKNKKEIENDNDENNNGGHELVEEDFI